MRAERTDWEVELAVMIGAEARYLQSEEPSVACIAGYAVSNDVSEREFQTTLARGQWFKGKCLRALPTALPLAVRGRGR